VNEPLLATLLKDAYYQLDPPKTAGREQYGAEFVARFGQLSRQDALATAAALTARTITAAIKKYNNIAEVIVSGGGAHNSYLMEQIRALLPIPVKTSAEYGIDIDAKEAIAFAVLAYEAFHGRPGNVPSATGASRAVTCGKRAVP
jgi:anhydro-N-acetylmuramic acid kinase